jgi:hypothetical protein
LQKNEKIFKLQWLKDQGYAGAFIWSLDTDDWRGTCNSSIRYPLQSTIALELGGIDINKPHTSSATKSPANNRLILAYLIALNIFGLIKLT